MKYRNNRKIIDIAIQHGYKTAKDFALFLKKYNPKIETTSSGKEIVQLSLI